MKKDKEILFYLKEDNLYVKNETNENDSLQKGNRPFYFAVEINNNYSAVIPLRSNIKHSYAFYTVYDVKKKRQKGIDYSKAFIIETNKLNSIKGKSAWVPNQDWNMIKNNIANIDRKFKEFIFSYKKIVKKSPPDLLFKEKKLLEYTTLSNYHKELEIDNDRT